MVRTGVLAGLGGQVALLAVLAATTGLAVTGVLTGLLCGLAINAALARGLVRSGRRTLGPADRVTLARATFVGGVAALVADGFVGEPAVTAMVALATVALVLDAVDGWTARRTGTASPLGARFDGEVDALLILILSVEVARSLGAWVLAIGLARYVFLAASWPLPWMGRPLPPRYWRKVVAAVQGIVLTVVTGGVLPGPLEAAAVAAALLLLTESFGRDVHWLWQREAGRARQFEAVGVTAAAGPA